MKRDAPIEAAGAVRGMTAHPRMPWLEALAARGAAERARLRSFLSRYELLLGACVVFLSLILVFYDTWIYRPIFYFAIIPLFALSARSWREWLPIRSGIWWASAALVLYLWASFFWGVDPAGTPLLVKELRRALCIILFVAITAHLAASDERRVVRLATALGWIAAAIAIAAMVDHYWHKPLRSRLGGFGGLHNANLSAGIYALLLLMTFAWGVQAAAGRRTRLMQAVPCAIMLAFVVLTGSRTALVGLVSAILAGAALRRAWAVIALILVPSLLYLALLAAGWAPTIGYIERGDAYRLAAWEHFWRLSQEHPWLGHGASFDQDAGREVGPAIDHPHNIYLSALLLGGIPAVLLLLALFAAGFRVAWAQWRRNGSIGPAMLLVYLFVNGIFDNAVYRAHAGWEWVQFWLPLGIIAGLELRATEKRRRA